MAQELCHCPWGKVGQWPEEYCDFCELCIAIHGPRAWHVFISEKTWGVNSVAMMYNVPIEWITRRNPPSSFMPDPWCVRPNVKIIVPAYSPWAPDG